MVKVAENGAAKKVSSVEAPVFEMRTVSFTLQSITPLSWSRYPGEEIPKCPSGADKSREWEERHWKSRLHTEDGEVVIPSMSVWKALQTASKQVKLKGTASYARIFETGMIPLGMSGSTGIKIEDVQVEKIPVPLTPGKGKPGTGPRGVKWFPLIREWSASFEFMVHDATMTPKVFAEVLALAGMSVGVGRWRPESKGMYGRFKAVEINWK